MCTRSVRRVMQLNTWMNAAWRSALKQIGIEHWPLFLWLVWHHSLIFCLSICHFFSFWFRTYEQSANRHRTGWQSDSLSWILHISHWAFNSSTCTDQLSCLTIWSLKWRNSWHVAKWVHKLLSTEKWRQIQKSASLFLSWCTRGHHVFIQNRLLYGD